MQERTKGFLALLAANIIWGLSPIYYKALDHVPPLELLGHRTIWSLVIFGAVLALQSRLGEIAAALRTRSALWKLCVSAVLISCNWGLFIWSIQVERTVEAALGYYIFPLISVVLGIAVFGEGATRGKLAAFGLAALAVSVLTFGLGVAPWVALLLACSFAGYGVIKKTTVIGPTVSVSAEVTLLAPIALLWLAVVHTGAGGTFGDNARDSLLLALSGLITAAPLILFSYASRRLRFTTLGLVLYLNPTLQFLVAVLIFVEPFTRWHAVALPMIWVALAIYSIEALSKDRATRKSAINPPTS